MSVVSCSKTTDIIMASFNVLFFACDRSVCVRKDGEFLLLDNPGEVLCKWLVENIGESGRPITEERDFKATVLFQSSVKKQCLMIQRISEDLIESYSGTMEGLKQVLIQRAQKEKQLLMECGSRGSAGRLKRVLRELQEEEITEKRCKEKIKAKQSGQDMIKVTNQTPAERTASQPGDASSQINLQKLQNLALLAGMATVLHSKSTSEYEAERENETVLETPLQFKDQGLKHAFSSPRHQFIPKQLFPMQELGSSSTQVTPPRPCKRDHKMMIHLAPKVSTKQNFMDHNSRSHSLTSSEFPSFPSAARVKEVDVNHTHHHADTFSNESTAHDDIEDPDKSFHLTTEESPSFHTGEMEYSSLSIINQNESYSVAHGSCLNETCVQLQAEVNALQAENEHLKAQLQGTCNSELAVQHLRAALSALTSSRNLTYTATSQICSGSFSVQKTDMQQLVKDSNDPDLFRNVLVPKRELHKLLEEAKAARDSACFLLNGVSEILFSPKELAAAKGVTKARAGTAALDEEKVDALFEFMKSVCRANGWPAMDNRTMRRTLAVKICNARRGLKKTPTLEMNNELADFS